MADPLPRLRRFLAELKRRNVYKVAVTYAVVVFVGLQAVRLLVPTTTLPGWADELLVAFAILGFPIALVLAWAFEMTPEGVRRTSAADGESPAGSAPRWTGLAMVAVLAGGLWYAMAGEGAEPRGEAATSPDSARPMAAADRGTESAPRGERDLAPARQRPFVAVLPLENLSPSEENAFFAAGVHEEILSQLSEIPGLGVFGRTTMRQYEGAEMSIVGIGRELGADAVLEGSVRRAGQRVRITAQLIDPDSRDHLWSESYERSLSPDAVFDIQVQIAERITAALETELAPAERERIRRPPTGDMSAYDAYVRGRHRLWEWEGGRATIDSAVADLKRAVARDSTFGAAHGLLAFAYGLRFAWSDDPRWRDTARAWAARADSLQADLTQTRMAREVIHDGSGEYDAAVQELQAVLRQQPGHITAMLEMSRVQGRRGKHAEALRWGLRAARSDPGNRRAVTDLALDLVDLGFYEPARAWRRHGLQRHPDAGRLHMVLVAVHVRRGEYQEAYEVAAEYLERHPRGEEALEAAGYFQLQLGHLDRARELLARAHDSYEEEYRESPTSARPRNPVLGFVLVRRGEEQRGRRLLREAEAVLRRDLELDPQFSEWVELAGVKTVLGETTAARDDLRLALEAGLLREPDSPLLDPVREEEWFRQLSRQAEAHREAERQQVLRMDLDLYPPGVTPEPATAQGQTDG